MISISNSDVRDYCIAGGNALNAAVGFVHNDAAGYTDGTYALAFSGGTGSGGVGTFTVTNGRIASTHITTPGTYSVAPTVSFAAATGGSGAAGTAVLGGGGLASINVSNAGNGGTITITDNTTYASDDARKIVDVEVYDYFGGKAVGSIAAGGSGSTVIGVGGLNKSRGFALTVRVVSNLGKVKDGSQFKIANSLTSGNFVIEK